MRQIAFALSMCLLVACQRGTDKPDLLAQIRAQGELVVVTRNAPTTYYELHDEPFGFEYHMTQAFAAALGVKARYVMKYSTSEVLGAIQNGEAHLAAAGLTRTGEREQRFLFGPVYQEVEQQVVCRRGGKSPRQAADLVDISLKVPAETSYAERLRNLQNSNNGIKWEVVDEDTETLLQQVWLQKLDCTVSDSNIVAINRRYYPELRIAFNLTEPEPLAWLMPADASGLQQEVEDWFEDFRQSGQLEALLERYYGFIDKFDYVDTRKFKRRIHSVLPKYRPHFEKAATKYELDWMLLAAQAYQESHWRARAISPTGVRGIMMLTLNTAQELGIQSRLDPAQSIMGGARYYKQLYQRIPESVREPDRRWFALAAYNAGMGHLYDARELAQRLGRNPDSWRDLSEVFPLLSQKKYYSTLKHGYARGNEPVRYVQRIRDYHDILHQTLR